MAKAGVMGQPATLIKILSAGDTMTRERVDDLCAGDGRRVYVKKEDVDPLLNYLTDQAMDIVHDPSVPIERKALVLHETAHQIMEQAMTDSRLGRHIGLGRKCVDNLVRFVSGNQRAVQSLVELIASDNYLYTHSVSVCLLMVSFGDYLGFSIEDKNVFGIGALFHDVGMRFIPAEVLKKPDRLAEEEYELIRRHPATGHLELSELAAFPARALELVRHHHENLNGTGYPDRLSGERLGPEVRIIRILDTYEALTSKRSYRAALRSREGIEVIQQEMVNQVDLEVLRSFISFLGYASPGRGRAEPTTGRHRLRVVR